MAVMNLVTLLTIVTHLHGIYSADHYYMISAHGAEAAPHVAIRQWEWKFPLIFFVPSYDEVEFFNGMDYDSKFVAGKIAYLNMKKKGEIKKNYPYNEHYAKYGKEFEAVSGVWSVKVENNKDPVLQILATFKDDGKLVTISDIANYMFNVKGLPQGTIYWNACRTKIELQTATKKIVKFQTIYNVRNAQQTAAYRKLYEDECKKVVKKRWHHVEEKRKTYTKWLFELYIEEQTDESLQEQQREPIKKAKLITNRFEKWAKMHTKPKAPYNKSPTIFNCVKFKQYQGRLEQELNTKYENSDYDIEVLLGLRQPKPGDTQDVFVPPQDKARSDIVNFYGATNTKRGHSKVHNKVDYDKELQYQEILDLR